MTPERYPWRYRCPECGSVQVRRYSSRSMPSRSDLAGRKIHHSRKIRSGIIAIPKYYCENCHAKFDAPKDMLISGSIPDGRKQQDPAESLSYQHRQDKARGNDFCTTNHPHEFHAHSNYSENFSRTAGGLVSNFRAPQSHGLRPGASPFYCSFLPHSYSKSTRRSTVDRLICNQKALGSNPNEHIQNSRSQHSETSQGASAWHEAQG